jgi:hypothetical protein
VSQISKCCLLLALSLAVCSLAAHRLAAQEANDDPSQPPLGDVARNLRKNNPPPQQVIDNDNLSGVVSQAENRPTSVLRFVMARNEKNFQVSAPDVTCSLSFTAGTRALLSDQYAQMDLPASEMFKLTGPATIEGDAFTVSLFNGTDWHVSEIDVALMVGRRNGPGAGDDPGIEPPDQGLPWALQAPPSDLESDLLRPERKADHTLIFKMRAAAPPLSAAAFRAPLNLDVPPGQQWHWAIIQAKGYPPQNRMATTDKTSSAGARILDAAPTQSSPQSLPLTPSPISLTLTRPQ